VVILEIIPKGLVLNNEAMQELAGHSMDSPRPWIERCLENIGRRAESCKDIRFSAVLY
jgi:hypothetical protein